MRYIIYVKLEAHLSLYSLPGYSCTVCLQSNLVLGQSVFFPFSHRGSMLKFLMRDVKLKTNVTFSVWTRYGTYGVPSLHVNGFGDRFTKGRKS